jgi:hypothetical protein
MVCLFMLYGSVLLGVLTVVAMKMKIGEPVTSIFWVISVIFFCFYGENNSFWGGFFGVRF